jgi:hypothetical protein
MKKLATFVLCAVFICSVSSAGTDSVRVKVDSVSITVGSYSSDKSVTLRKGQSFALLFSSDWKSKDTTIKVWMSGAQTLLIPKSVLEYIPSSSSSSGSSSSSSSSGSSYESTSRQCSGTTKKGNRCSRMTTSSSGRCWQH